MVFDFPAQLKDVPLIDEEVSDEQEQQCKADDVVGAEEQDVAQWEKPEAPPPLPSTLPPTEEEEEPEKQISDSKNTAQDEKVTAAGATHRSLDEELRQAEGKVHSHGVTSTS